MGRRNGPKRQKKFLENWGSLPSELLDSILESLPSIFDYIQFSLVCKHWRKVALNQKEQRLRSCHKQLAPLLLLNSTKNSNQTRALYSVTQGKVVHRFNLPNHRYDEDTWLCGSSHGWLAYADASFMVTLVNPFTRGTIRLPQVMEVVKSSRPECNSEFQISKVVLSANPSLFPNDYEVLVIFENDDGVTKELAHFKSGDNSWTRSDRRMIEGLDIIDATYYKGRFVALTGFDSDPDHGVSKVHPSIECISHPHELFLQKTSFLVKSTCEDLLLVNTSLDMGRCFGGTRIFKLGRSCGPQWVKMESFGTDALFLDNMNAICVSASYSGCHPNSIYLLEGVVNLSSGEETWFKRPITWGTRSITWIAPTMAFSI
ncbi:PREDICTED: F-box protein SKIP23-like [Fragaria vesca subsp. vesca]|uniref:F-box protein SKIP23-like n=1 Tax=Fragaria vesca subsp. vesca TaxID=101020 RepID=UPI0002C33C5E|nr:PREDICTED: F-box protein SKIP23-like [Fragaria vesca subsp. vesca]